MDPDGHRATLASRGESCGTMGESDMDYRGRSVCTIHFLSHGRTDRVHVMHKRLNVYA